MAVVLELDILSVFTGNGILSESCFIGKQFGLLREFYPDYFVF